MDTGNENGNGLFSGNLCTGVQHTLLLASVAAKRSLSGELVEDGFVELTVLVGTGCVNAQTDNQHLGVGKSCPCCTTWFSCTVRLNGRCCSRSRRG